MMTLGCPDGVFTSLMSPNPDLILVSKLPFRASRMEGVIINCLFSSGFYARNMGFLHNFDEVGDGSDTLQLEFNYALMISSWFQVNTGH